jgi:putative salt-induced outer membrane protein
MSRLLGLVPAALGLVATSLLAQDPAPVVTKITADLGFVQASGNSQVTTTSFGQKLTQQRGLLGFEQTFTFVYGEQNGEVNTNFLRAGLRADYKLGSVFSAFATVAYDRNVFAGIQRRFEENLGFAWQALGAPSDSLRLEAGFSVTQQLAVGGTANDFPAGRLAAAYRRTFSPTTYFLQMAEVIPNFKEPQDLRVNTESAVVAPVSGRMNLKVAYLIRYDNLPEPTFRKTDRVFTTGIQIAF